MAGAGIEAPAPTAHRTPPTTTSPCWTTPSRPNRPRARFASTTTGSCRSSNIHEAIPGHYTQLIYANRATSRVKALFGNGAMVEGWAVYAERMMVESGYGDSPEMRLMVGKWHLRSVTNTVPTTASMCSACMKQPEALDLLQRQAFQTEQEAREKWRRVQLTAVQLTSYFSGYSELIVALREQLQARARLLHSRPFTSSSSATAARSGWIGCWGLTQPRSQGADAPARKTRPRASIGRAGRVKGGLPAHIANWSPTPPALAPAGSQAHLA